MKNTLSKLFIFAAGAAVGYVATRKMLEEKYKQIAQIEIDSVREAYRERHEYIEAHEEAVKENSEILKALDKIENKESEKKVYVDYRTITKEYVSEDDHEEVDSMEASRPRVIPPDEFGELYDYDQISLTYYADGVLADDWDNPIEDVDDVVGLDSLKTFGRYEDDSVFVRNDALRADYEILRDLRNYSDVVNKNPHSAEDR